MFSKRFLKSAGYFFSVLIIFSNLSCSDSGQKSASLVQEAEKLMQENKVNMAIPKLQKAIEVDPQNPDAYRLIGDIYFVQEELDKAEQYYLLSAKFDREHGEVFNKIGRIKLRKGSPAEAVQFFAIAIQKDPDAVEPNFYMGEIAMASGEPQVAVKFYEKVLSIDPDYEPAKNKLAQIAAILQNAAEAREAAQGAAETMIPEQPAEIPDMTEPDTTT